MGDLPLDYILVLLMHWDLQAQKCTLLPQNRSLQFDIAMLWSLYILYLLLLPLICFQGRFADALLRELAGVTLPPERLYGLGTGLVLNFDIFGPIEALCGALYKHFIMFFIYELLHSIDKFVFRKLTTVPR